MAVALTVASIVDMRGPSRFRDPHILGEPSAWLLHGLAVVVFIVLAGVSAAAVGRSAGRARVAALLVLTAAVVASGVIGLLTAGAAWGFPLADVVWIFDVTMLGSEVVAFAIAIALGTPGCEIGVWGELIARVRGAPAPRTEVLACVVGLHLIDRWEAERRGA